MSPDSGSLSQLDPNTTRTRRPCERAKMTKVLTPIITMLYGIPRQHPPSASRADGGHPVGLG